MNWFKFSFSLLTLLLFSSLLRAGDPPVEPILRIEPGNHISDIRSISSDGGGRWLVTASLDKTAKVWNLNDGTLSITLRPPSGELLEGQLSAIAISPDGKIVVVGGWTQFSNGSTTVVSEGMSIYFFDRASGRLINRVSGMANTVVTLRFTPDGRFFIATLGGREGIRIFNASSGALVAGDSNYGDSSYSADFRQDKSDEFRLVTTSSDGFLRLYRFDGSKLTLLTKKFFADSAGGTARFSPDGSRIAFVTFPRPGGPTNSQSPSFVKTPLINVFDGVTLAPLYFPDIKGVDIDFILAQGFSPFLISVAWSIDGQTLFAGGNVNKQGQFFIRRWTNAGKGSFEDWPVAGSYIRDLVPLANGKLAFSTISPASWGVLNLSGERVFFHGPAVADFRDDQGGLKLSADGMQVHFGFEAAGKSSAVFDIAKRTYIPENTPNLLPPLLSTPGISITDWNYTFKPKLNGVTLKLWQPMDRATSLAILPSGGGFVLGSWFGLQVADKLGNLRWFKPIPVHVLSVNTSADGRLVVAALGDGTIHWYRATDGIEQLVLYPHPDKKRWVMWTPEGYYDASAEGEDLIGWQLNQGNDKEARFIPNGQLYDVFFRPDIVQAKMRGDDISGLISITAAEALKKPPPNVGFTKIPISSKNIKDLAFPRFSRHVRMLTMNRRELHETNEIYSRVQNRGCQTSYRKRSFSCRCC